MKLKVSGPAKADLRGIGDYSVKTWGPNRAFRYLQDLEARMELLAE